MNSDEKTTREKIVLATIDFIEKYGINAVTTRGIAKEAGVNSAAINYYFGSKEKLLDETLKLTLKNLQVDFTCIIGKDVQAPGDLLQSLLYYLLAGSMKFPGITKAHLYGLFVRNEKRGPFVELFEDFMANVAGKMGQIDPAKGSDEIKMSVIQLFSAVLLPCIFPEIFKNSLGLDFKEDETQKKYINSLVKHFYPVAKEFGNWHPSPLE